MPGAVNSREEVRSYGRQGSRACWVLTDLEAVRERAKWPGPRCVIVVVRGRIARRQEHLWRSTTTAAAGRRRAEQALGVIRGHWGIENSLHWVLDVIFDEDRSRVRKDHGPENLALLRRMAVSMLKAEGGKGSIRGKRLIAGWNNDFMEKVPLDFAENSMRLPWLG